MLFPTSGGVVMLTTAANAATDVSWDALRIDNSASPRVRATINPPVTISNALGFDANERLSYVDATAGLPVGTVYANGMPFAPSGALCVSTDAPAVWANGVPLAANGAVSVGITP